MPHPANIAASRLPNEEWALVFMLVAATSFPQLRISHKKAQEKQIIFWGFCAFLWLTNRNLEPRFHHLHHLPHVKLIRLRHERESM